VVRPRVSLYFSRLVVLPVAPLVVAAAILPAGSHKRLPAKCIYVCVCVCVYAATNKITLRSHTGTVLLSLLVL